MSDDQMDELLRHLDRTPVRVSATFQDTVWRRLEGVWSAFGLNMGLARFLAVRAAPAALALVVGGVAGASMIVEPTEQDLLGVFDTHADWSLTTLGDDGEHS